MASTVENHQGCAFCRIVADVERAGTAGEDVMPRRRKDGLRGFFWPRTKYPDEAAAGDVRDRLRPAVSDLR